MLARVADSLYWIGRYLERADRSARLLEVHLDLRLYAPAEDDGAPWHNATEALQIAEGSVDLDDPDAVLRHVLSDPQDPESIRSCIGAARENARQIRDVVSTEMWEQLNRLWLGVRQSSSSLQTDEQAAASLRAVQEGVNLFRGIGETTYTHGQGWEFLQLGFYIERAVGLTLLLTPNFRVTPSLGFGVAVPGDDVPWAGLLRACSALEAYSKTYTAELRPTAIAEFLLFNGEFPHSLRYSVGRLALALDAIASFTGGSSRGTSAVKRGVGQLKAHLEFSQVEDFLASGAETYLTAVRQRCDDLHDLIFQSYIAYSVQQAVVVT